MTNNFLAVDKRLFKTNLSLLEILVYSQINEFSRTTGDCFISDETLGNQFNVSDRTIQRILKSLEEQGYIKRDTKNIKGGKERHLIVTNLFSENQKVSSEKPKSFSEIPKESSENQKDSSEKPDRNIINIIENNNNTTNNGPKEEEEYPTCTLAQARMVVGGYKQLDNNLIQFNQNGKIFKCAT